jgi:hypothetical protein
MSTHRTIVITFLTLDGVMQDPGDGTPNGGWAFRHGPERPWPATRSTGRKRLRRPTSPGRPS